MTELKKEMLKIYKPYSNLDWMNYKLVRKDITAHHIIKKCDGGLLVKENIALLMPVSHEYLHIIECKDIEIYTDINKFFKLINMSEKEPTIEVRLELEKLLKKFELLHQYDLNAKGKPLIREKYKRRWK